MGKVVMPKNSAVPEEIQAALKIYFDEDDWLENSIFVNRLKKIIGEGQYHSSYTKKVQMLSYFGFTIWEDFKKPQSKRRITASGKRFYLAWNSMNKDAMFDEIMYSLEHIVFGRNNCGCSDSDSDIEIPSIFIRTAMKLDYLIYSEFAFLLWQMEDRGMNYTDAVKALKAARLQDNPELTEEAKKLVLTEEAKKYSDAKPIMMLIRWGFLEEDGKIGSSIKIVVSSNVIARYSKRLQNLKIYNIDKNLEDTAINNDSTEHRNLKDKRIRYKTGYKLLDENLLEYPQMGLRNRIFFGAPGTGKSYTLNMEKDILLSGNPKGYERVTLHPDYTYANFVGTYKPTVENTMNLSKNNEALKILTNQYILAQEKYDSLYNQFKESNNLTRLKILVGLYSNEETFIPKLSNGDIDNSTVEINHGKAIKPFVNLVEKKVSNEITYEYVPGPFMRILIEALENSKTDNIKPYLLIIEEINRANIAAVFGDVFQLLDRGEDEASEYPIQASEDMKKYLAKKLGGDAEDYSEIGIPDNLFIWATMNSADQGVFPMDTAFKRRWDFTYMGIDLGEEKLKNKYVNLGRGSYMRKVEWNELRKAINDELSSYKVNEDKLLGPYFLSKKIVPEEGNINEDRFIDAFKSKVIMYLFDDAAKQKRSSLFAGCVNASSNALKYSSVCEEFKEKGVFIFANSISTKFSSGISSTMEADDE